MSQPAKAVIVPIDAKAVAGAKALGFDRGKFLVRFLDAGGFCLDVRYCQTEEQAAALAKAGV